MKKVLVVVGPTASGKTAVSIKLAKELGGEIVSADSMQIYKYMNIGTAKPTRDEMEGIPHYLIDEINPDEEFSVTKYKELALKYIKIITSNGKMPIVVGGTGLYINSLIYNYNFSDSIVDWDYRKKLEEEAKKYGTRYLHERLKKVDPKQAEKIHENNVKRVIRALEIYEFTKKTKTELDQKSRIMPPEYDFMVFGLNLDRDYLYERINMRVDKMFEQGLVSEVEGLIKMGYKDSKIAMQALGYKEVLWFLEGKITLEEAKEIIKRDTRRYAKRQLTWFRKIENIEWIDVKYNSSVDELVECIKKFVFKN